MKCVILQPSYIPWRGYFHQIQKADVFVFYDCVQYDDRGWRNRNKIKTAHGEQWVTVPVNAKGCQTNKTPISEIPIVWSNDWAQKHEKAFRLNYARAPFFVTYAPLLEQIFGRHDDSLADFTCATTELIARHLGIEHTQFLRSSDLPAKGSKTDRLISILKHLGATHYISGPSARSYIENEKFQEAGITVEFMTYDYPEYPQINGPFLAQVTILDLLFNTGADSARYIWR